MEFSRKTRDIGQLYGKTLIEIQVCDDLIIFRCDNGEIYHMVHLQDCCELVVVEDIVGDINDLIGTPIVKAEKLTNSDNPRPIPLGKYDDSFTWTFYTLATIKGYVTIRWYGTSNGWYSEDVDIIRMREDKVIAELDEEGE